MAVNPPSGNQIRRAIACLSVVGATLYGIGLLRQTRVIKRLPDLPLKGFDSNKVMMSRIAFPFGIPDTALALGTLLANFPLLRALERSNGQDVRPSAALAGKAVIESAASAWYLWQLPTRVKAWCGYCIAGGLVFFSIGALSIKDLLRQADDRRLSK
jgi:uncharacterized membrane protein